MRSFNACITLGLLASLTGCALNLGPSIGWNLPSDPDRAQQVFDQRVHERYPIGSSEAALVSDLRGQGFGISDNRQSPLERFRKFAIDCSYISIVPGHTWEILWTAVDGRITDIGAIFIQSCH
jgi:hypothetical protein